MRRAQRSIILALLALLSACAPQLDRVSSASAPRERPVWAFEASDVPVDPAFRFGRLANGMRYVVRHNATPKGAALVRMEVAAGSLDESDAERGYAHFVEHMAFNGSTNVPEGEMVRLLERKGLAFGADTNAETSFDHTTYKLDLPRNDPDLLDTALMLMRETASELTISPEALARERGLVLAEMRDRNSWQLRNLQDQLQFLNPEALYARRLPIGATEALEAATSESMRAFWRREYVPAQTTIVVIGDFPPDAVEAAIRARFDSWRASPAEAQPSAGPVEPADRGRSDAYIDPALAERVAASRHGAWIDEPDTIAQRRENILRQIGYGVVNRRLQRLSRTADPPFRGAGLGTAGVFEAGRTTNLIVDTPDGKWRRGLVSAATEYRRAMKFGFTRAEVAEQVANLRSSAQNAAASAATRGNSALVGTVFSLLRDDVVPSTPEGSLERLEAFIPEITPKRVLAALKREAVPIADPLLRFSGRRELEGGAAALRAAWNEAMRRPLRRTRASENAGFAYTSFGPPGRVVADSREAALGIRQIRFANGVRLNLKNTGIEKDRVLVQLSLDGGEMLDTREQPLSTEMAPVLPAGGLGKHSQDELQSILAGRTVASSLSSTPETFVASAATTPRDLELQLQLFAAFLTDPGYRKEGEVQYRLTVNNFFAQLRSTPGAALTNTIGGLLSDNDPRFTLGAVEDYRKLDFARLKAAIGDRLTHGAIEIGLAGDIDEEQAIALVARTFGALPAREPDFRPYAEQRSRSFTANRAQRIVRHTGPKDQALLRYSWPTRDDSDPVAALTLELLERVTQIELTETLREKLGKAYSPSANSNPSHFWPGYGVFGVAASAAVAEIKAVREAIAESLTRLRTGAVSPDELDRARQPLLQRYENALKVNGGWMTLVDRAQTEPDQIDRFLKAPDRLKAIVPADVLAMARRYLAAADGVEILVLPEGVDEPKP